MRSHDISCLPTSRHGSRLNFTRVARRYWRPDCTFRGAVNAGDPDSAQQIVAEYARVLERDLESGALPAPLESLPFAKPTIQTAIKTSVATLSSTGQLTPELMEFLETAYVSLADYLPPDLLRLIVEYTRAADELAADTRLARDKTSSSAWKTMTESGRLAGEIARSIAEQADELRKEFKQMLA